MCILEPCLMHAARKLRRKVCTRDITCAADGSENHTGRPCPMISSSPTHSSSPPLIVSKINTTFGSSSLPVHQSDVREWSPDAATRLAPWARPTPVTFWLRHVARAQRYGRLRLHGRATHLYIIIATERDRSATDNKGYRGSITLRQSAAFVYHSFKMNGDDPIAVYDILF